MAIANYVQIGNLIDYTPAEDVVYNQVVALENRIAVAAADIPANTTGSISMTGVYDLPADSGVIAFGATVYFDKTKDKIVAAAGSDTVPAGIATVAKISAGTTCRVRID